VTGIFEALEKASREETEGSADAPIVAATVGVNDPEAQPLSDDPWEEAARVRPQSFPPRSANCLALHLEDAMSGLYHRLMGELTSPIGKSAQFIGARRRSGASVLAREFAKVCALRFGKSVLLLDASATHPSHLGYFGAKAEHGWEECVEGATCLGDAVYQVGETALYISQMSARKSAAPQAFEAQGLGTFLKTAKQTFDLTLVDSPAESIASDGIALSEAVDGVVLVVEAERTRRQTARNVVNRIRANGGHIVGTILNKRRYPIPAFLYNRL